MKIKKAINLLNDKISSMTEMQAQEELHRLLESYELQLRYGAKHKMMAFTNSIYTPTLKKNEKKEEEISEQTKKNKNIKYRTACRYENDIRVMKEQGNSHESIAKFLNKHKVHKRSFFNKVYIFRFCKEKKIS